MLIKKNKNEQMQRMLQLLQFLIRAAPERISNGNAVKAIHETLLSTPKCIELDHALN